MVALRVADLGRIQSRDSYRLSDLDRAAVQQVLPARRRTAESAHRTSARTLRLQGAGPDGDGRLAPLESWQRLLHGFRQIQAHRVFRHAADPALAERDRSGAGARARSFQ